MAGLSRRLFNIGAVAAASVFGTTVPSSGSFCPTARLGVLDAYGNMKVFVIPFQAATAEFGAPYEHEGLNGFFLGWTPEWAAKPEPDPRWVPGIDQFPGEPRSEKPLSTGVPHDWAAVRKMALTFADEPVSMEGMRRRTIVLLDGEGKIALARTVYDEV